MHASGLQSVTKYLISVLFCFGSLPILAQKLVSNAVQIVLPDSLRTGAREFSGLTIANQRMYFLCENRADHLSKPTRGIYSVAMSELDRCISEPGRVLSNYTHHSISGVDWIIQQVADYQGLEALVISGNLFFVTVETDETADSCYLFTGTLHHGVFEVDTTRITALPKPKLSKGENVFNAGFEALVERRGKLYAIFEFNSFKSNHIYEIDKTNLTFRKMPLNRRMPFRTTDAAGWNDSQVVGVNYFFPLKAEHIYTEHLSKKNTKLIRQHGEDFHPMARLVFFKIKKKKWKVLRYVYMPEKWWTSNWEGIARHKKGVFLVNDKFIRGGGHETQLIYLTLD